MGRDKALLAWHGIPMARRVANALAAGGCEPVFAVGGNEEALSALGLRYVSDHWPGEGPVGAVLTALRAAPGQPVVVVACDMPQLSPPTVASLVAALDGGLDVAVAVTDRVHPLCAAWSPAAVPMLTALFADGVRRMGEAVAALRSAEVHVPSGDVQNVNAPSDLPK